MFDPTSFGPQSTLTIHKVEDAVAKLRRATDTPMMVLCHPDHLDAMKAKAEELGWLRLGTLVKGTDFITEPETVYLLQDPEERHGK